MSTSISSVFPFLATDSNTCITFSASHKVYCIIRQQLLLKASSMAFITAFIANNFNLDDKITILQNKAQLLAARAADITSELHMADLHLGKKRRREVQLWLRNVRQKESEIHTISNKLKNMTSVLPNVQIKDDIARLSRDMQQLIDQGEFRNGLTLDINNTRLPLVTRDLVGKMCVQHIQTISRWLGDDKVHKIGIYGMGGVGKSSLIMHIHNMLLDNTIWGAVYWVTATQGNVIELQNKIARSVGLYLSSDEDPNRRAAMLSSVLSRVGKIVLILDDLWNHCPLEELGVPISSTNCKIVVTTRSLDVCCRMACQTLLKVEPLPEGEAWRLFVDCLGNYNTLSGESKEIARSVARECGGLPLGIRTMARALSGVVDVDEWNNALQDLRRPLRGQGDMENEVFPVLRFSFCHLNDTRLQKCFLSCVLYPEGHRILREELIDLWISEGSLEETETREEQFQKGNTILNRLENSCLLEAKIINGQRYVQMHDLLRDMAISITKCSPCSMVYPKAELTEVPNEDLWPQNVEKASFIHNHISEIPPGVSPDCPKLTTLLLQWNPLENISDSFFVHMKSLKVLNLSFTRIKRVPESISNLENLFPILVNGCWNLTYVPSLTRLQKLRELDFRHTRIKDGPDGLDRLTNLRCLDLSQIKDLSIPLSRILPRLYNLQVFKLSKNLKGKHLMGLSHLERIHCRSIFDMNDWVKFIESRHHWKLKNYNFILLGTIKYSIPSRDQGRLSGLDRIVSVWKSSLNGGKKGVVLPRNIQYLGINYCQFRERGLIDAIPTLETTRELRVCEIRNCEGIDYLWSPTASLPKPIPSQTFSHFQKLHIYSCPTIKKLFPFALLEQQLLPNLQEIELVNCPSMTEIISANEAEAENVGSKAGLLSLPKLKTLTLCNLPVLESICRGLLVCNYLNSISKESCPMLKMIPLSLPLLCDSSDVTLHYLPTDIEWWTSLDMSYPKDVKLLRHALIKRACLTSVL